MSPRGWRTFGLLSVVALAAAAWLIRWHLAATNRPPAKAEARVTQRSDKIVAFKSADEAASYGIASEPVKLTHWHPRVCVDGRVLPNPNATLEICVPRSAASSRRSAIPNRFASAPR